MKRDAIQLGIERERANEPANVPLVAHSPPSDRPDEWHRLDDHLDGVAELARRFASAFRAEAQADLVARLHDLGKATDAFQAYIRVSWRAREEGRPPPRRGSAPHAIHGALLLWRWLGSAGASATSVPGFELAQAVLHHHGRIRNAGDSRARLDEAMSDRDLQREAAQAALGLALGPQTFAGSPPDFAVADPFEADLLTRFLVSALVDADRLDTEAFADRQRAAARTRDRPSLAEMRDVLASDQAALQEAAPDTPVNRIRREMFEAAVKRAGEAPGTFRLTVPTGGGKTRTSLAFALEHAVRHGMERVVIAIPFTSIIEQTADVYRGILGSDAVVEHHGNVVDDDAEGHEEDRWAWRLPTENWDAPVIVTTTVQLFESLFSNRTSRLRKVHRLARSVIVLDEAQSLPTSVLAPIVNALGTLTRPRFGSSVVLCTATQPALDAVEATGAFSSVRELAPDPVGTFRSLARVAYDVRIDRPVGVEELAESLRSHA
ncbi:MAG: CRISPR-associated endonuclease Cas3'', partial [Trueperaceae bacterium]